MRHRETLRTTTCKANSWPQKRSGRVAQPWDGFWDGFWDGRLPHGRPTRSLPSPGAHLPGGRPASCLLSREAHLQNGNACPNPICHVISAHDSRVA